MKYTVILSRRARKQLQKINRPNQLKIGKAINLLADNPHPSGRVLLKSKHTFWRICVGDYRIIYQVKKKELIILIVRIRHRKEVYQNIERIKL